MNFTSDLEYLVYLGVFPAIYSPPADTDPMTQRVSALQSSLWRTVPRFITNIVLHIVPLYKAYLVVFDYSRSLEDRYCGSSQQSRHAIVPILNKPQFICYFNIIRIVITSMK